MPMLQRVSLIGTALLSVFLTSAGAQTKTCVPLSGEQLVIYRAGSLTRAFVPLEEIFRCQTGIQVKDAAMASVDAARQITAGGLKADLYAPADYLDIDLLMEPAGYSEFSIVFAHGRMVLAYSERSLAAKKLPPITAPGSRPFKAPDSSPKASERWYEVLLMPGVTIGGGHPFLDPGAYRGPMIFQLSETYYKVPNLYNNLLEHVVITGADPTGTALGRLFDFQFTYEHNARATAAAKSGLPLCGSARRIEPFRSVEGPLLWRKCSRCDSRTRHCAQRPHCAYSGHSRGVGHHIVEGRTQQEQRGKISPTAVGSFRSGSSYRKRACANFPGSCECRKLCAVTSIFAAFGEEACEINFIWT